MPDNFQMILYGVQPVEKEDYEVELAEISDSVVMYFEELPNDETATSGQRIEEIVEEDDAEPTLNTVAIDVGPQIAQALEEHKAYVDQQHPPILALWSLY